MVSDLTFYNRFLQVLEEGINCDFCKKKLGENFVSKYQHTGGINTPDSEFKQWVYVQCQRCFYCWSWWKIIRMGENQKL